MKLIKLISEWPLSKVELVEYGGRQMIRKTVHKDFAAEFSRQQFLRDNLKNWNFPEIYKIEKQGDRVVCFMEYVESDISLSHHEVIQLMSDFHSETLRFKDASFPVYDFAAFKEDLATLSKYGKDLNAKNFTEIFFNHSPSIVHGDLGKDQLLLDKDQKLYMIDFGRSFWGPPILDIAYYCIKNDGLEGQVGKLLGINSEQIEKAKTIARVMQVAWFDLCQTKYIKDHDYKNNEIAKELKYI